MMHQFETSGDRFLCFVALGAICAISIAVDLLPFSPLGTFAIRVFVVFLAAGYGYRLYEWSQ